MSPEMTGDTEKGKSMSVVRALFPTNSNLAMSHDAASPKTRLSGTAMPAAINVSFAAAIASGSFSAEAYSSKPFSRA